MSVSVIPVLGGTLASLSFVIGLLFLRYWRSSHDRLFIFFTAAFWLMGANWGGIAAGATDETRPYLYLLRLAAFLLIAVAIVDKNRRE